MDKAEYNLIVDIKWSDLQTKWNASEKPKGIRAWLAYHFNYGKYGKLANFGATIISDYQIPYNTPKQIGKK